MGIEYSILFGRRSDENNIYSSSYGLRKNNYSCMLFDEYKKYVGGTDEN